MTGSGQQSAINPEPRSRGPIPKHELRKIKQRVSRLRKQGHEIFTDEEVENDGWVLSPMVRTGLHVGKEKQKENWDCGLACVQMVLGVLGDDEASKPPQAALRARIASESVWTIDVAYLLAEYGVECQYLTATAAVDETAYSHSAFYASSLAEDARRVNLLFRHAAEASVDVQKRTLSAAELWNLCREEDTLVIALVDVRLLYRRGAEPPPGHYLGHYVLIVGLDDERGGYVVNDPARDDERTFVPADALETARHAEGTDQDLLLIPVYQSLPTPPPPASVPRIVRICATVKEEAAEHLRRSSEPSAAGAATALAALAIADGAR